MQRGCLVGQPLFLKLVPGPLSLASQASSPKGRAKCAFPLFYRSKALKHFLPLPLGEVDQHEVLRRRGFPLSNKEKSMEYTKEELLEAKRQIDSTLHKLRETVITLEGKGNPQRYKSQITLAKRRIKAFEIANYLIDKELEAKHSQR